MTSRLREVATRVVVVVAILLSVQQFVSAQTTNTGNGAIVCQVTMGNTNHPEAALPFSKLHLRSPRPGRRSYRLHGRFPATTRTTTGGQLSQSNWTRG
jgi:hypothetical protein